MAKKLKLGIIGMSEGNGHPYSWSAIFNGYNPSEMAKCPFPVIPEYLAKESFPDNFLTEYGEVTHIWTQDLNISRNIAKAALISNICNSLEDMIGHVDAVLLARDDAENHYEYAKPFLQAGLPIYIDKPFATNRKDAERLWQLESNENQIFSCSALQFAKEFQSDKLDMNALGEIKSVLATIPKSWKKYAVHIIEPVLKLLPNRGAIETIASLPITNDQIQGVQVGWNSGVIAQFQTMGSLPAPLVIRVQGTNGYQELHFKNSFYAFKMALKRFIHVVNGNEPNIKKEFTLEMVQIIEGGNHA